jgi:hypothetical protein
MRLHREAGLWVVYNLKQIASKSISFLVLMALGPVTLPIFLLDRKPILQDFLSKRKNLFSIFVSALIGFLTHCYTLSYAVI